MLGAPNVLATTQWMPESATNGCTQLTIHSKEVQTMKYCIVCRYLATCGRGEAPDECPVMNGVHVRVVSPTVGETLADLVAKVQIDMPEVVPTERVFLVG